MEQGKERTLKNSPRSNRRRRLNQNSSSINGKNSSEYKEPYKGNTMYGSNPYGDNSADKEFEKTPLTKKIVGKGYDSSIIKVINSIEDCYKLNAESGINGYKQLRDLPISLLHQTIGPRVDNMSGKAKRARNISAAGQMASLLYLDALLKFNQEYRINFENHPGISGVSGILSRFTNLEACKNNKKGYLNAILESLQLYESISLMRINWTTSYKLLRLFYILVLYDNLVDASIVANMTIYQVRFALRASNRMEHENIRNQRGDYVYDTRNRSTRRQTEPRGYGYSEY